MYVHKAMKSGNALRVAIPRDAQRHMGIRWGDLIALELREGGKVEMYKLNVQGSLLGRAAPDPTRSDR